MPVLEVRGSEVDGTWGAAPGGGHQFKLFLGLEVRATPHTLYPTPYTLHPASYTLLPTPYTLHSTPYILHPTPCILHPAS